MWKNNMAEMTILPQCYIIPPIITRFLTFVFIHINNDKTNLGWQVNVGGNSNYRNVGGDFQFT